MNLFTVDLESFEYSRPAHSPLSLSFIWSLLLACKTCNYESLCCIYWPLSCSNTKVFSVQRQSQHKRAATQRLGLLGFTFHQTGAVTYHSVCTSLYIIYILHLYSRLQKAALVSAVSSFKGSFLLHCLNSQCSTHCIMGTPMMQWVFLLQSPFHLLWVNRPLCIESLTS